LERPGINVGIILKWTIKKYNVNTWNILTWLQIKTNGGLL